MTCRLNCAHSSTNKCVISSLEISMFVFKKLSPKLLKLIQSAEKSVERTFTTNQKSKLRSYQTAVKSQESLLGFMLTATIKTPQVLCPWIFSKIRFTSTWKTFTKRLRKKDSPPSMTLRMMVRLSGGLWLTHGIILAMCITSCCRFLIWSKRQRTTLL